MADAVVGALLGAVTKNVAVLIAKLLEKRCAQLKSLEDDIGYIGRELQMIAGAKEDQLSGKGDPTNARSISMEEMRDLAHDIEDCLDRILRFTEDERKPPILHRVLAVGSPSLATEVKVLKERLKDAHQRKHNYNVNNGQHSVAARHAVIGSSTSPTNTTTVEPVGMEVPKQKVLKLLHDDDIDGQKDQLKVISIVGFGGLGKSTLAKAVYDSPDVAHRFPCRAWVVASKHGGDNKGLLTALFGKLRPGDRANGDVEQLQAEISNYLSTQRYLIVLDDIKELPCLSEDKIKRNISRS